MTQLSLLGGTADNVELESLAFRPLKIPLLGTSLLEASAGTGKTYTITTLYLRLLLERSLTVREILVVTYTRAATAELRERIRKRLQLAYDLLNGAASSDDATVNEFVASREAGGSVRDDSQRLLQSIRDFDQAAIFSIHSFCQRVLQDNSFESGSAFDAAFLSEQSTLVSEICNDYWATQLYEADSDTVRYLLHSLKPVTPEMVLKIAKKAIASPGAEILPQGESGDGAIARWKRIQTEARSLWLSDKDTILALMSDRTNLKGNMYPEAGVHGKWADGMARTLEPSSVGVAADFDKMFKFGNAGLLKGKTKKGTVPTHDFFSLCDELMEADSALADMKASFYRDLADFARSEMHVRKGSLGVQSFDDLLTSVAAALKEGKESPLARIVRKRFPAALIDEFQDTDPVQYGIFSSIYHESKGVSLFLIGDPKQAIYGFRGADIFAYLDARKDAGDRRYTLGTNWRSDPPLVNAVNTLFGVASNPFVYEAIEFKKVDARQGATKQLGGTLSNSPALELVYMPRTDDGKRILKGSAWEKVPRATAGAIAKLLTGGGEIDGAPIAPSDVAVLVRKNAQAQQIQLALRKFGVPSVVEGDASVFETEEALHVERFLAAVLDPSDSRLVLPAVTTMIYGFSGSALEDLQGADGEFDAVVGDFRKWQSTWVERGFIQAYREILADMRTAARLLQGIGGQRSITNLYHLGELLQSQVAASKLGPKALFRWMKRMRRDRNSRADSIGESGQIRLESDADAVKIVTIHKSKGLEYPIVYCPYLWDGALLSRHDTGAFTFHSEDSDNSLFLDLGSEDVKEHELMASRETLAENMRLLYVALTRAKHLCSVTWGAFSGAESSPLGFLLHQETEFESSSSGLKEVYSSIRDKEESEILADLHALVDVAGGSIAVSEYMEDDGPIYVSTVDEGATLEAVQAKRNRYSQLRFSSFTALLHQSRRSNDDRDADFLYGQLELGEVEQAEEESALHTSTVIPLAEFPKGARVGIMVHEIFEGLDYLSGSVNSESDEGLLVETCEASLLRFGLSVDWAPELAAAIQQVLNTPLRSPATGVVMSLSAIARESRIDEMEFVFPTKAKASPVTGVAIAQVLKRYGDGQWSSNYLDRLAALAFQPLSGYMRGFVDLIFCFENRYYLVDYKTNHLGDIFEDYQSERLTPVMDKGHYHLQYLIYTVALHRYLGLRLPDYSYDNHFGGVYYLFVRGMSDSSASDTGVFASLPPRELVEKLSELFGGESQ